MSNFFKIGVSALFLSILLAFCVAGLIQNISGPKYTSSAAQLALKNIQGINKFESIALNAPVSISTLYSYDRKHGTKLSYMASELPSVSVSQLVTEPDFVQLRIKAENQIDASSQEAGYWWNFFYIIAGGVIIPILNGLLTKLTDEYIYPWIKDFLGGRFRRRKSS